MNGNYFTNDWSVILCRLLFSSHCEWFICEFPIWKPTGHLEPVDLWPLGGVKYGNERVTENSRVNCRPAQKQSPTSPTLDTLPLPPSRHTYMHTNTHLTATTEAQLSVLCSVSSYPGLQANSSPFCRQIDVLLVSCCIFSIPKRTRRSGLAQASPLRTSSGLHPKCTAAPQFQACIPSFVWKRQGPSCSLFQSLTPE